MLNIIAQLHVSHLNFNNTFKNLVQFFSKNLQRSESKFLKLIECIESKTFLSQCNVLNKLVKVAGRHDHFMKNRMAIFFMPKQNINYYQAIINAVIQNLEVDFITLMNEATLNCRNSCKFKDPHAIFLKNAKCAIKNSPTLLSTNKNGDQHGTITTSTNENNKYMNYIIYHITIEIILLLSSVFNTSFEQIFMYCLLYYLTVNLIYLIACLIR
jgi:hypothetical protein